MLKRLIPLFFALTAGLSGQALAANDSALIDAKSLAKAIDNNEVVVIDFRNAKLPGGYIPGAVKLAHADVMENRDGRKRMLVSQQQFEKALSAAGISADDHLVIYDDKNSLWATRLWWSLKSYGHKQVQLLDGNLNAWKAAGFETNLSASERPASQYRAQPLNAAYVADFAQVQAAQSDNQVVLLDARGTKDTDKGIIAGATIIEWSETQNADGTFKSRAQLQKLFAEHGLKPEQTVINYCNSGIKASVNTFALQELAGFSKVENYDGSMIDYRLSQPKVAVQ